MNDRKQHVINMAHQLFIEKGFQATSIQDILDYSGISKGTFYNYFSSKNELIIALFKTIYKKLDQERNELLIGQDPSNIEIFIMQIELQMKTNRTNKLMSLFEEVFFSKDEDLKKFIKGLHLRFVGWIYKRFIDIFGESKKPYLLDCAIMFIAILNYNYKYYMKAYDTTANSYQVIRYSVARIEKIVYEVADSGDQLFQPSLLDIWLPENRTCEQPLLTQLQHTLLTFKNELKDGPDQARNMELLDFIHTEIMDSKTPRKFLIESAISTLKANKESQEFQMLEQLISDFFSTSANPT
ncbi:TetR/AcrR family transcriptional regulator [Peribacillus acanthi]|uniref:TetR/AcrR family transcriptional regulator n=1 Tax=Peribacillus acanthi TaxID=2171554 RepID=UPI000D3E8784|nr:TetR/AcrR family transcriptional regulator [Peribacillus acanthi]